MYLQVTTTMDSREAAWAIARSAVAGRLAACAQVGGPIQSVYRWEGEVEEAQEWVVVFKVPASAYPKLENHIRQQHSYEVPEILATPVEVGNPAYLRWITESTNQ